MKVGLILSGGMAKGAYQIGALRAISEHYSPGQIAYISAASVGALNAIAFSAGELGAAEEYWRGINRHSEKVFLSTLYKSDSFRDVIAQASEFTPKCKKLFSPVLSFRKREVMYPNLLQKSAEDRALYLRAAIAFPPFTKAVKIHGRAYCDGALADNIPYYPLISCNLDYILCIYFDDYDYIFKSEEFTRKVIKIPFAEDSKFISTSLWFTRQGVDDMIRDGYTKTSRILDCVLSGGGEDPEGIYERIRGMNDWNPKKKVRLTGDVIVNNVNRLLGRFAKRTIID